MRRSRTATLALCLLFPVAACQEGDDPAGGRTDPPPSPAAGPMREIVPPAPGSGSGAMALTWTAPEGWVAEAPSTRMRKAQYRVPGDGGDAECVVFYFGPGEGGDAMANAERWAAQFTLADGRPGTAGLKLDSRKVNDIEVLSVEVAGTYESGFPMQRQKPEVKPDYMLLGAVAKGPDANWFFKLTGPQATVAAQRAAFEALIGSLRRGS